MNLPQDFTARMKELLRDEADDFFASYNNEKSYGLRVNPLKYGDITAHSDRVLSETVNLPDSEKSLPFTLAPVAWAKEGFYAVPEERPGRHPLHEGGAYYIQEPSAMSVVSLLDPQPGDIVCDLCAAPGGKSTQAAGRLSGQGLLVSNEIFPARAKILSQNIERLGVSNCVVCNEPPDKMAAHFPQFFDKIVVDAPCSGEGMFRKDDVAIKEWSLNQVEICRERQQMILECADQILLPGGIMVYSTCTFAPDENENMIAWFLETHPDYSVESWHDILPPNCGLSDGRVDFLTKEYSQKITSQIPHTLRLWPHKLNGEGHFVARLRKHGTPPLRIVKTRIKKKAPKDIEGCLKFADDFLQISAKDTSTNAAQTTNTSDVSNLSLQTSFSTSVVSKILHCEDYNCFHFFGDELYLIPQAMNSLDKLKVIRPGLHLGTRKKNRFEPAHALAMALSPSEAVQCQECDLETAQKYLHGETVPCDVSFKSWTLITYKGVSLGWGKAQNGIVKNHYPKGLRLMG